jgi:hypothetical protein
VYDATITPHGDEFQDLSGALKQEWRKPPYKTIEERGVSVERLQPAPLAGMVRQ